MKTNTFHTGNFINIEIPNESIDLIITSPPYDNLRDYKGYDFDYKKMISQCYDVLKQGGIMVWVVGDATIDGSETGTSFKQALYGMEVGFNLHDTMIYAKNNYIPLTHNRYEQQFEYMFVFSKGKPKTFKPLQRKNKWSGIMASGTFRENDSSLRPQNTNNAVKEYSTKPNIWYYDVGSNKSSNDKIAFKHPAQFPEQLAKDHVLSWSNEGDVVLDPMCGSGTTCKMAYLLDRKFIGIDISEEYIENIAKPRLRGLGWDTGINEYGQVSIFAEK